MPNILPGLDKEWEKCFEILKQVMDKPETKEHKEMVHGKGNKIIKNVIIIYL